MQTGERIYGEPWYCNEPWFYGHNQSFTCYECGDLFCRNVVSVTVESPLAVPARKTIVKNVSLLHFVKRGNTKAVHICSVLDVYQHLSAKAVICGAVLSVTVFINVMFVGRVYAMIAMCIKVLLTIVPIS